MGDSGDAFIEVGSKGQLLDKSNAYGKSGSTLYEADKQDNLDQ